MKKTRALPGLFEIVRGCAKCPYLAGAMVVMTAMATMNRGVCRNDCSNEKDEGDSREKDSAKLHGVAPEEPVRHTGDPAYRLRRDAVDAR